MILYVEIGLVCGQVELWMCPAELSLTPEMFQLYGKPSAIVGERLFEEEACKFVPLAGSMCMWFVVALRLLFQGLLPSVASFVSSRHMAHCQPPVDPT